MTKILIFDCDGVISDLNTKKVDSEVLFIIMDLLRKKAVVVFNSGRSFDWIEKNILKNLDLGGGEKERMFVSAEFGGVIGWYNTDGRIERKIDKNIKVSGVLMEKIKELIETDYSKSTLFDQKDTMISLEMRDNFKYKEYAQILPKLKEEILKIIEKEEDKNWEVVENPIAIDVRDPILDKKYGTKKVLSWLKEKGFQGEYVVFGDQPSDLEIGEELVLSGIKPTFVYVGEEEIKEQKFEVKRTDQKYTSGTLEYLKEF